MTLTDLYRKEKYIVLNSQTKKFRIIKWIIILTLLTTLYFWQGMAVATYFFLSCAVVATCVHFVFRWKTDAWTKSWGWFTPPH